MKMTAADQTKEVVELAVGYTKQIVEALTPLAKQAYEIGLLTLRVDAASILIPVLVVLVVSSIVAVLILRKIGAAVELSRLPENSGKGWPNNTFGHYLLADGVPHVIGLIVSLSAATVMTVQVMSVWLWVKLFSPELWLAHQAVEKLLK
jgi:hypothetical protein